MSTRRPARVWRRSLAVVSLLLTTLLLLEVGLRLLGPASARAVFVPVEAQPGYRVLNAAYVHQHLDGVLAPEIAYDPFQADKPAGTFRVIVLGGSTAAGFPYRAHLGFPARLQQRLEVHAAGQSVEVINLGVTGSGSYLLWDLKDAVAAQQPDAVVIYAGHDEYYGAFGVGSALGPGGAPAWLKRLTLRLRRHSALLASVDRALAPAATGQESLLALMVADEDIPLTDPKFERGRREYEANLRATLTTFQDAGIPVYLATVAANLRDQPPLGNDEEAITQFVEGRTLFAQGDTLAARAAFHAAKEQDELRFRAPDAINAVTRALAEEGLATLVDLEAVTARRSDDGVGDFSFFLDHVHPTYEGYEHLAEALYQALQDHPALQDSGHRPLAGAPIRPDAYERSHAYFQIFGLSLSYPFIKGTSPQQVQAQVEAELRMYRRSRHYLDSLTYATMTGQLTVSQAVTTGIERARARGEVRNELLLYRTLLHLHPFDDALLQEAVAAAQAQADSTTAPLVQELLFHAVNRTGDASLLAQAGALRERYGLADAQAQTAVVSLTTP